MRRSPASPSKLFRWGLSWPAGRRLVKPLTKRLVDLLVLLFGLTTLLFFALKAAGDQVAVLAGNDATPEQIAALRAQYGFDRPLAIQYLLYMLNVVQLDFGASLATGQPALMEVLRRLPATLLLAVLGMGVTVLLSVPIGAWLRGELRDWAEALLDERRLAEAGILEPAPVRRLWQQHLDGRHNWQHQLWAVLMFEAWRDAQDGLR